MERALMSIQSRVVKQNGVYPPMEHYSATKKNEWLIMWQHGGTSKTLHQVKKPVTEDHILYGSVYMKDPEQANPET